MIEKFIAMTLALTERKDERGATATEYGLLVALIALIIVAGVGFFGQQLDAFFTTLGNTVDAWN